VLGDEQIVGLAQETDVLRAVVSAPAERVSVVELQPDSFRAPVAPLVNVAATAAASLVHGSPHGGRNVS
jgi:hypothetical protein